MPDLPDRTRAKFRCDAVTRKVGRDVVELRAVTDTEAPGEDSDFAEASPYGEISITIDNEAARGWFEPGQKYYVEFRPAE